MKRRLGEIIRIHFSITLGLLLVLCVILLIVIYFCMPIHRDHVKFVAFLLGGTAGIYSAYYVGAGLRVNIERDKRRASFEILNMLNRPEFVYVRNFLEKEVEGHDQISAAGLYQKIVTDTDLHNAVTIVLGIFEDASIAVQCDYVNEDVLYMSLAALIKRNFEGLRGYIEKYRREKGNVAHFIEVEKLYNAWERGRKLSDGERLLNLGMSKVHGENRAG